MAQDCPIMCWYAAYQHIKTDLPANGALQHSAVKSPLALPSSPGLFWVCLNGRGRDDVSSANVRGSRGIYECTAHGWVMPLSNTNVISSTQTVHV